jgi:hypothetical protein
MNTFSKIMALFFATFMMVYFVGYQNYKKLEDLAYIQVNTATVNFVDSVRHTGSEVLYEIEMEHYQKTYNPVYTNPADKNTFTGEYTVDYEGYYKDQIADVLFNNTTLPIDERQYKLQKDDLFSVTVTNKTKFKSTMMLNILTFGYAGEEKVIYFPYGGAVLNEDWNERR